MDKQQIKDCGDSTFSQHDTTENSDQKKNQNQKSEMKKVKIRTTDYNN
jgi:hypothetical protein